MVLVTDYQKKKNSKNGFFYVLSVSGGTQMVRSESGSWVVQALSTNIIANLDELSCKAMIGKSLPGTVVKKEVLPYKFTTASGEEKTLHHKYEYVNDEDENNEIA